MEKDSGTIDLRRKQAKEKEPVEFQIGPLDEEIQKAFHKDTEFVEAASKAYDKVKIKFDKFVNLVATHAYEDIFAKHRDEDVIVSTGLLADLANAHEEKPDERKVPFIFIIGILLGVAIAWLILKN